MQSLIKTIILAVPVGITVVDVVGYVARVDGESMKPTLNPQVNDKEYVFLNKVSFDQRKILQILKFPNYFSTKPEISQFRGEKS
jgi:signal peptidase I